MENPSLQNDIMAHLDEFIQLVIKTSYHRELLYQLEHIIHHNAIIRPIVEIFLGKAIQENFGYATSTIKYQAKHVSG